MPSFLTGFSLGPVLLILLGLVIIYVIGLYNNLSSLKVRIQEAWSQIDIQLKRRIDLVPNLVETVRGYAAHEKEVFENVTKARAQLMQAQNPEQAGVADSMLASALKSLFAVAEAYPQLKAQEGFVNLQNQLSDTEDKIAYARQFYNTVVREYNEKIVVFPSNIIASAFGFKPHPYFELDSQEERNPVKVEF